MTTATRAINISQNIDIEWYQIGGDYSVTHSVVYQSNSATLSEREFNVIWVGGMLVIRCGGVTQVAYNAPQIQFNVFIYLGQ